MGEKSIETLPQQFDRAYTRGDCAAFRSSYSTGSGSDRAPLTRSLSLPVLIALRSEGEFGSYLNDAYSSLEGRDEIGRTNVNRARNEQIGVIENIVKFSAKLKAGLLSKAEALVNAEIDIPET